MLDEATFAEELGPALHRAADGFTPDERAGLVAGGVAKGRRRAARRRGAVVATSVLVAAGIGLGGTYAGGLLTGSSAKGASTAATSGPDTTAEIVRALRQVLPHGTLVEDGSSGGGLRDRATASGVGGFGGVLDDGKGRAAFSVDVRKTGGTAQDVTCPEKGLVGYDSCHSTAVAGGGRVRVLRGYEYPDRREPTKLWSATRLTATGSVIEIMEWNAPAEKGAEVTRTDPPLSEGQLRDAVSSKVWNAPLKSLPVPERPVERPTPHNGGTSTAPDVLPSGTTLRKTLRSLLPAGIQVIRQDTSTDGGYTYLVIDDGHGATRLEINAQPHMNDVRGELFGSDGTGSPKGTELATHQDAGEKGGVGMELWRADTIRPDGFRVVVMESNGEQQGGPATRPHPALSMAQLSAIVTSEKWLHYLRSGPRSPENEAVPVDPTAPVG